jgi:hypothetical protein
MMFWSDLLRPTDTCAVLCCAVLCCAVLQGELATIGTTMQTTAILEAGRISLDSGNRTVKILYADKDALQPCALE